jgi:RHS repeat-associated protein
MTEDKNKGLDKVTYNHLILPKTLVGGGKTIIYIYYANGQKLLKTAPNGTETYYAGNFVYEDDELQYILHSEGKIDMSGGTPVYQFNLKDHLGNVRAMTDLNGNLEQVSSYYPFGMLAEDASLSGANNKYRYNGKELQDDAIGNGQLDWYDYGARFYDPALGRFHTQDRFSEKYYSLSNYQYAANNPILNIDVNGDSIRINYGNNQELLYTPGMKYSGNDKFVSQTVDYLNNINSVKGGNKLIGKLNSSTDDYKFINKTPVDKKGNQLSGTFQFKGNSNDGGGTILAGEFKNSKISGFAKVEGSAHE